MKPFFKVSLLAATVMLAVGCQKEEAPKVEEAAKVEQAESAMVFKTDDDKAAYAIGISFANYLESSLVQPAEIGVVLEKEMVTERYRRRIF